MCEFHGSNGNSFGDIWWTDKLFYFNTGSIDVDNALISMDKSSFVIRIGNHKSS